MIALWIRELKWLCRNKLNFLLLCNIMKYSSVTVLVFFFFFVLSIVVLDQPELMVGDSNM